MIRLPRWLYLLLAPLVFLGSCTAVIEPLAVSSERKLIRPVRERDMHIFPVIIRSEDGRFGIADFADVRGTSKCVTEFGSGDEEAINRDLNASKGFSGTYRWFQLTHIENGVSEVSLEFPSGADAKTQSWYRIRHGVIEPDRFLCYGPGFAYLVMPWSFAAGLGGLVVYLLVVRPKRKSTTPSQ
jgi:hypothetical protein